MNEIKLLFLQVIHFILYVILMFAGGVALIVPVGILYIIGETWWVPFFAAGGNDAAGKEIAFEQYALPFVVETREITPSNFTIEIAFVNSLVIGIGLLVVFAILLLFLYALNMLIEYFKNGIYAISHRNTMQSPPLDDENELDNEEREKCKRAVEKNDNEVFKQSIMYMRGYKG